MSGALQMRRQQVRILSLSPWPKATVGYPSFVLSDGGKDRDLPHPSGRSHGPEGYTTRKERALEEKKIPFTNSHRKSLERRGLKPKDYVFVKETYCALYVRNIHTGVVKIIYK